MIKMGINMKENEEEGKSFEGAMKYTKPVVLSKEELKNILQKEKAKRPYEDEIIGVGKDR